jgi:hypothetical protein
MLVFFSSTMTKLLGSVFGWLRRGGGDEFGMPSQIIEIQLEARRRCRQARSVAERRALSRRKFAVRALDAALRSEFCRIKPKNINDFRDLVPKLSLTLRLQTNLRSGAR